MLISFFVFVCLLICFLKSRPKFHNLLQSYYWPLLFLLFHGFPGKRRMGRTSVTLPEQVISSHVCPLGGHRKQVAVLIVITPNSCPSWREFRSGQEVSGLLCPPRFAASGIHNNLRYVPSKGDCLGILTVLFKLSGYLAGRAECCCCRVCLGLQLESSRITKNSIKKCISLSYTVFLLSRY